MSNISFFWRNLLFGFGFFGLGVYEAIIASDNNPNNTHFTNEITQGYVFCIIKSIINLIGSLCLLMVGMRTIIQIANGRHNNPPPQGDIISILFSIGISIWSLVMIIDNYDVGPFYTVVLIEATMFIIEISICYLLFVTTFCIACCYKIKNNGFSSEQNNSNNQNDEQMLNEQLSKI